HVDDAATAVAAHDRNDLLDETDQAEQVRLEHRAQAVQRNVLDGAEVSGTGVVDQGIDALIASQRLVDDAVTIRVDRDVGRHGVRPARVAGDLLDKLDQPVPAACHGNHRGAAPCQPERRRAADPGGSPGHDGDLPV